MIDKKAEVSTRTPKSIGDEVRQSANSYFKSAQLGKKMPDVRIKKVFTAKVKKGDK